MEQSMSHEVIEDTLLLTADTSSGYHSHDDENKKGSSSLELENRLLKNEVTSLNQEMASVIERAKNSQEGGYTVWLDSIGLRHCFLVLESGVEKLRAK